MFRFWPFGDHDTDESLHTYGHAANAAREVTR